VPGDLRGGRRFQCRAAFLSDRRRASDYLLRM
jgi:hypothetical protein